MTRFVLERSLQLSKPGCSNLPPVYSFWAVITAPALLAESANPKLGAGFELQQKKMRPGESNRGDS